jgi:pimeloyl-ACP methyl ester carboxylesterase
VFGDASHVVRAAYAKALLARIPSSRVVHIAASSHCPMIEAPAAFYGAAHDFLEIDVRGGGAGGWSATYSSAN